MSGIGFTAPIQRGIREHGQMNAEARGAGVQARPNGSSADSGENQGLLHSTSRRNGITIAPYSSFVDESLQFFKTPQGEVYGFVDKGGNIYLDETIVSPNHGIHEYTHFWDRAVQCSKDGMSKPVIELEGTNKIIN